MEKEEITNIHPRRLDEMADAFKDHPSAIVPDWVQESSWDANYALESGEGNLIVLDELAQRVVEYVLAKYGEGRPEEYGNGSGQKSTEGQGWVPLPAEITESKGGFFVDEDGVVHIVKSPDWWSLKDSSHESRLEHKSQIPDYATYEIGVVERSLEEERELIDPDRLNGVGTTGNELEFVVVTKTPDGKIRSVNIQSLIRAFKKHKISASIEGWDSQFEHPSKPREQGLSVSEHTRVISHDLLLIDEAFRVLGLHLVPTAVMPFTGQGHSNFENAHVRHVLMRGMAAALGHDLTIEEASIMLAGYGVNGLHITVDVQGDDKGLVGDERLNKIFNLTHGKVVALMKAWTLNGNLESVNMLVSGRLSNREAHRRLLETARVGEVRRLFDKRSIKALEEGLVPSLERAALCNEDGEPATGVHNPLGRQKESGRNEFTVFDVEANIEKIMALESLLTLYTTAVDRAVLRDNLEDVKSRLGMTSDDEDFFLSVMTKQSEFDELMETVEEHGLRGEVMFNRESFAVGEVLVRFIDWVEEFAKIEGITEKQHREEFERVDFLRDITLRGLKGEVAENFEDYFNKESEYFAVGTLGEIAYKRFNVLVEKRNLSPEDARAQVIVELAEGFYNHLDVMNSRVDLFISY